MEPINLDAALDMARAGDQRGITFLFRAFQPQLLRYLNHKTADAAEDVASETWMAAARGMSGFVGNSQDFRSWIFAIARRRLVDHYRRLGRRPQTVMLDSELLTNTEGDVAEDVVAAMSSDEALALLVRDLSPDQAEVLVLRVVVGLSVAEVAGIMQRSAESVRTLQHPALCKLGDRWSEKTVTP